MQRRHVGLYSHLNVEVVAPSSRVREVSGILPDASLADAKSKTLISIVISRKGGENLILVVNELGLWYVGVQR
jgi:hypothetical protein